FDVNEAKITRYIPVTEDDVQFAAGMTQLVVFLPGAQTALRYNLLTGEREKTAKLEGASGKIEAFCMGLASAGPLLVCVAGGSGGARLFDIDKFEEIPLPEKSAVGVYRNNRLPGGLYWAGATGRIFGHTGNYGMPNGVNTVVYEGGAWHSYGEHKST